MQKAEFIDGLNWKRVESTFQVSWNIASDLAGKAAEHDDLEAKRGKRLGVLVKCRRLSERKLLDLPPMVVDLDNNHFSCGWDIFPSSGDFIFTSLIDLFLGLQHPRCFSAFLLSLTATNPIVSWSLCPLYLCVLQHR